jgi:iron complex outermembrane recepter protein
MKQHNLLSKAFLTGIAFIFSMSFSFSQNATIKGTVKDDSGIPLSGATIQVMGSKMAGVTDSAGNYLISVAPGKYTINISYAGFSSQRISIEAAENGTVQQDVILVSAGDLANVVVVGSRNLSRTKVETPVPVDIIPIAQVISDLGQVDLNQILNFIAPSFQSARQTIADGTDHVDPAQLRGLGTDQVLVLINGKRRHQSALVNVNGTVNRGSVGTDMSAIPATAIERIEILRDGAAAQYGSDAIAGVINIVLKKKTGVLEAGVSYGQFVTKYDKNFALYKLANKTDDPSVKVNDGGNFQASVGYGFDIGSKGHLNITGEYIKREPTNRTGTYTGAVYPNVGGVNRDDSILSKKGLTRNFFDMNIGNSKMTGGGGFYNFGYPLSDKTELYIFGGATKKRGVGAGFYRYPSGIPNAANAGKYAPNVFAIYPNGFLPQIKSDILDFSTSAGVRTKFGAWNFDISNTFGINKFDFNVDNSVNYSQFFIAGNRQTSFDAGGLKFWQNTVNADISKNFNVLAGLNVAGGLEYRVDAFGIQSGEEASYKNYDTASKVSGGAQVFAGFENTIGDTKTRNAKAVYADLELDVTRAFLITGALRFENYSDFGSTLNYKFATRYKFSDAFNLRASASSGFRAPSMQQRFYAKRSTLFLGTPLAPNEVGTFTNDSKPAELLGIPKLKEETSQSYSVGLTARPFRRFEVTVDAYQIDIDDRIVLTNNFTGGTNAALVQQLKAAGADRVNFFTNAIDTRARGLEAVLSYNINFRTKQKQSLRTTLAMTFIDNEVKKGADGKPIVKASDILVNNGQLGNYFNREDQSRIEVANPQNKINLTFNYRISKFGAMLRFVNFGKVTYLDPTINSANPATFQLNAFTGKTETLDQEFSAKTVTDLSVSYQITPQLGITLGANNLLDVYQDRHTHSGNVSLGRFVYSRRVQQMGFNGAYYFARLKLNLEKQYQVISATVH